MASAVLLVAGSIVLFVKDSGEPAAAIPVVTVPPPTTTTTQPPEVPVTTKLATPDGLIRAYATPGGQDIGTVGRWYERPVTMPILQESGEWLLVMRPERPNGSIGWVRRSEVAITSTAYRIVLRLGETRLYVYKDGYELFSAPVGIGKDSTRTPTGSFFIAVLSKPGPHGYGPIVLDTSGHSEDIWSWQGSGDAVTAIHGPISASSDARIGTTGTKISNGCIRMHIEDLLRLDVIPLGTPIDIVA
ncbi:MAG: L,D-transpeptidase [Acidimicrobiales bacterium]